MSSELALYIKAGYALTPNERLEAARMLRLSVDQDVEAGHGDLEAAWDAVIERRVEELVGGEVEPVSGRESFARLRVRLDKLHR